jgi:hypothetical protein
MVIDVVLPEVVKVLGVLVMVQLPAGKLLNTTLPVATVHVGCVIVPTVGFAGEDGCVLITTLAEATDVQLTELVTVNV